MQEGLHEFLCLELHKHHMLGKKTGFDDMVGCSIFLKENKMYRRACMNSYVWNCLSTMLEKKKEEKKKRIFDDMVGGLA